jgi:hypothetical protein
MAGDENGELGSNQIHLLFLTTCKVLLFSLNVGVSIEGNNRRHYIFRYALKRGKKHSCPKKNILTMLLY